MSVRDSSDLELMTRHHTELATARMLPKSRGHILQLTLETSCCLTHLKTRTADSDVESSTKGFAKKSPSKHFASTFAAEWVNLPENRADAGA